MTIKIVNAKTTANLIEEKIECLEIATNALYSGIENPQILFQYNKMKIEIAVLHQVLDSLHGNHTMLRF